MSGFIRLLAAIALSYLVFGVLIALAGLCLKAWYLIFMMGWDSL